MRAIAALSRWALACSVVAMCGLTFIWPFMVSADPSHPVFRFAAVAALTCFLSALVAILAEKACKAPRT